ncbi:MAG: radical SAM protein [Bacteroidales bacterium]|nr:radical SAM protein [Bacteroidales bacterium]
MTNLYRPIWTCGRYNSEKRVVIFYNLIEGMSYFFEAESAAVVGAILSQKRNVPFTTNDIYVDGVDKEDLYAFIEELLGLGLVTTEIYNDSQLRAYRETARQRRSVFLESERVRFHDEQLLEPHGAEFDYADAIEGIASVMLEMTYRCSEMCLHCYNPGATRNSQEHNSRGDRKELTLEDYKQVIDELYEQGLSKVCLSGGDPFSKDITWQLIDYLFEKEVAFDIFTNGISICEDVERLANYYPRLIGVSLYSDVAEVHDKITRVIGSHRKTKRFIASCYEFGIPMNIKCCIMRPNVATYFTVKNVAEKYGALAQFDINITDSVEGDKCASQLLRLSAEQMEIVLRDPDLPYYINEKDLIERKEDLNSPLCSAGITSMCITPEGIIQPCCSFPLSFGNVTDGKVCKILSHSRLLEWWKQQRMRDCKECNTHEYCVLCQFCAGNNYVANGTPLKPSENEVLPWLRPA